MAKIEDIFEEDFQLGEEQIAALVDIFQLLDTGAVWRYAMRVWSCLRSLHVAPQIRTES